VLTKPWMGSSDAAHGVANAAGHCFAGAFDGVAQAVKDAATFFESELTGPTWTFGPEQAAAITCPVLSVLGSNSSPLFVEGRQLLHAWFPACQDANIVGATHLLQMQAPGPVAAAIAAFL
jgi:pimeloyl-ACP methyl ester carboxylesterase